MKFLKRNILLLSYFHFFFFFVLTSLRRTYARSCSIYSALWHLCIFIVFIYRKEYIYLKDASWFCHYTQRITKLSLRLRNYIHIYVEILFVYVLLHLHHTLDMIYIRKKLRKWCKSNVMTSFSLWNSHYEGSMTSF
jgi:hypothetical protein